MTQVYCSYKKVYIVYLPSRKQQCKTCSFLQQGTRYTFLQNHCIFTKQETTVQNLFILVAMYRVYFPTKLLYIYQVGSNSAKPVHSCSKVQGILSYKTIVYLPSRKQQCKNLFILVASYKVYLPSKLLYIYQVGGNSAKPVHSCSKVQGILSYKTIVYLPSRKQQCITCSFLQQGTRYTFLQNYCIFTKQEATVQNLFILVARYKVYFPTKPLYIYQVGSNSAKPVHSCSKVHRYTVTKIIGDIYNGFVAKVRYLVARYKVYFPTKLLYIYQWQEATVQNLFILVARYKVYFPTKLLYIYQVGSNSAKPVHSCSNVQGILSYKTIVYLPSRKQQCKTCSFLQQGTRYTFLQNYCIFTKQEATVQNLFILVARYKVYFPTKSLYIYQVGSVQCETSSILQQGTRYTFLQNYCIFTMQEATVQTLFILASNVHRYTFLQNYCKFTKQEATVQNLFILVARYKVYFPTKLLYIYQVGSNRFCKTCSFLWQLYKVYFPTKLLYICQVGSNRFCKTCSFLQQGTRYTFLQNHCILLPIR